MRLQKIRYFRFFNQKSMPLKDILLSGVFLYMIHHFTCPVSSRSTFIEVIGK